MKKISTFLVLLVLVFIGQANAQTNVPAVVSTSQTWTTTGSPYIISQNTLIDAGVKITIQPGVTVRSTDPKFKLLVSGGIEAVGTSTALIQFDSIQIEYSNGGIDYNRATGTGSQFIYCQFKGARNMGVNMLALKAQYLSVKVESSSFEDYWKSIEYRGRDTSDHLWFTKSVVQGPTEVYTFGTTHHVTMTNNLFRNIERFYFYGPLTFEQNYVDGLKASAFYVYRNVNVSCNTFVNSKATLGFWFFGTAALQNMSFNDNVVDSFSQPMITINRENFINKAHFNNNNFLSTTSTRKVVVSGTNRTPATADTIDFTGNYWGQTGGIDTLITDYTDDILIFGLVNYGGSKSTKITPRCSGCDAYFTFEIDQTSSKKYTFYGSNFPDGGSAEYKIYNKSGQLITTLSGQTPSYTFGNDPTGYEVRYFVKDSIEVCDSAVAVIPCRASFFVGQDTSKAFELYLINNSTGQTSSTQYYWTFGDGTTSTQKRPKHTYSNFGLYEVCLTISDSASNCSSTYCDSLGLDSNGVLLKAGAFTLNVIDEADLSVDEVGASSKNNFKIYPNPAGSEVTLELESHQSGAAQLIITNLQGQAVQQMEVDVFTGLNRIQLNVLNLTEGSYFVRGLLGSHLYIGKMQIVR